MTNEIWQAERYTVGILQRRLFVNVDSRRLQIIMLDAWCPDVSPASARSCHRRQSLFLFWNK